MMLKLHMLSDLEAGSEFLLLCVIQLGILQASRVDQGYWLQSSLFLQCLLQTKLKASHPL
jgi:hypothetical protein